MSRSSTINRLQDLNVNLVQQAYQNDRFKIKHARVTDGALKGFTVKQALAQLSDNQIKQLNQKLQGTDAKRFDLARAISQLDVCEYLEADEADDNTSYISHQTMMQKASDGTYENFQFRNSSENVNYASVVQARITRHDSTYENVGVVADSHIYENHGSARQGSSVYSDIAFGSNPTSPAIAEDDVFEIPDYRTSPAPRASTPAQPAVDPNWHDLEPHYDVVDKTRISADPDAPDVPARPAGWNETV